MMSGTYWVDANGGMIAHDYAFTGHNQRSRRDFPYSFDAYFTWRDFDKHDRPEGMDHCSSDTMRKWDEEAYSKATKAIKTNGLDDITPEQAKKFVEVYYGGTQECIGHAAACNQSNGAPYGIFFMIPAGK